MKTEERSLTAVKVISVTLFPGRRLQKRKGKRPFGAVSVFRLVSCVYAGQERSVIFFALLFCGLSCVPQSLDLPLEMLVYSNYIVSSIDF